MAAIETDDKEEPCFRKPDPCLWTAASLVIVYVAWCVLLLILAASGHLFYSFECELSKEARLVCLWSGLGLLVFKLLLGGFMIKKAYYMLVGSTGVLCVIMCVTFYYAVREETQNLENFESRHLLLLPLNDTTRNAENQTCNELTNVYRWQAELKCCGLRGYWDWGSSIPDSCLCDGEDSSSGCVRVGGSFVYEKPCLPTVLSLLQRRSTTFWTIMITWITITGAPSAICMLFIVIVFPVLYCVAKIDLDRPGCPVSLVRDMCANFIAKDPRLLIRQPGRLLVYSYRTRQLSHLSPSFWSIRALHA